MSADITQFIKKELNNAQRAAVTHEGGPILVTACAGSGKTRVITARIAHMIAARNITPSTITALTFTNKAAHEMKTRIAKFLPQHIELPFVGTFHAYCVRLLKKNSHLLETPFFSIIDEDDRKKLVHSIVQRNNLQKQLNTRNIIYQISHAKNNQTGLKKGGMQELIQHPLTYEVYLSYEQEKKASRCLDFDDLLRETYKLFEQNKDFKKQFQQDVHHLLIDEYQDTNTIQHELLKHMTKQGKKVVAASVCAVGDEDQSIYSWRGATVANIMQFKKDFPKTTHLKIEQNYRSVQPILDVANAVITNNCTRSPKKIWSEKKARDRVRLISCISEYQEGTVVATLAQIMRSQKKNADLAVLYRTHAQSRALEESLIRSNIPYKIIGGVQFYERKEIKDLLAYLRLIVNPFDRTSFMRIINTPARGLGAKFEEQFHTAWQEEPFLTFEQIARKLSEAGAVSGKKKEALVRFLNLFPGINPQDKPSVATQTIITGTNYLTYLKDTHEPDDAESRSQNVQELIDAMRQAEGRGAANVGGFLEEVALMQEKTSKTDQENAVLLMTLHAAKGLEFNTVVLAGLEDGLFPASRAVHDDEALEEERRLFYVGITRAQERLLISHAKFRYTYGQMTEQAPSRFLNEIPRTVTHDDCSYWQGEAIADYCASWLGMKARATPTPATQKSAKKTATSHIRPASSLSRARHGFSANKTATKSPAGQSSPFFKGKTVRHKKYGIGIVESSEKRGTDAVVTVRFGSGRKKIISRFLQGA